MRITCNECKSNNIKIYLGEGEGDFRLTLFCVNCSFMIESDNDLEFKNDGTRREVYYIE